HWFVPPRTMVGRYSPLLIRSSPLVQILLFCVACSFTINLKAGQREGDDIAFHFNPRVGTPSVVRNTFRNGQWQNAEETSGGPFVKGGAFDLFMVVKPEGYEVIVNGYVFCMYWHRMPVESVSALNIRGDTQMKWENPLRTGYVIKCRQQLSRKQTRRGFPAISNMPPPTCIPFVGPIPGGLRPGMALYFQGVPFFCIPYSVVINLKLGPKDGDDIAFHFNARINNSVVRDSCRNGKWEGPEETQWCPIVRGSAFDIFITLIFSFQAYVNGQKNCFFKHRMPVEKVTTLNIKGEVIMNTIGYVAVSHLLHDKWIKSFFIY
uniref:Galectin n=1 Tax=Pygocentrus nattereri TaxID=42514 RepID=A0A3B4CW64_PYGNA